jgi:hypothetical protein
MTEVVSADTQNRLAYLADTIDLLFPGVNGTGPVGPLTVLPSSRAPRLLVPVRPRRAAATAVRRYTAQQGARQRFAGAALAAAIRSGLCDRMPHVTSGAPLGESIWSHLTSVFGQPIVTTLAVTSQRPNRKPVLQVFDAGGHTIGFAKVGATALAARLVAAEAAALTAVASLDLPHVDVPRIVHYGAWRELPVLVTSPLPRRRSPRWDSDVLVRAMREVSQTPMGGVADYLASVDARSAAAVGPHVDQWREVFGDLTAGRDLSAVPMGPWHGDFTEWNCARTGPRLAVWDWERYSGPAPVGFDRLHYLLNHYVRGRRNHFASAAARVVADSEALLAPWNVSADDAHTITLLYLLDIALRYITDDLRSTDPGGRVEEWALPVVRTHLARPASGSRW